MGKKKLIYYEILNYQPENLALLHEHFDVIVLPSPNHDTSETLSAVDIIIAPLGYYCGKDKIDRSPRLKVIASNTTGTPHIDEEYAGEKGIKVLSLKNEIDFLNTITPTAEHTWGLMLALMRNVIPSFKSVCEGGWSRWPFGAPAMLSRMSLGIVGLGRIGKMVARYGSAFGMAVRYYDPYVESQDFIRTTSLEELASSSDVLTLHVHLNEETSGLIDKKIFSACKKSSYLINTARGRVVDSSALIEALESGRLKGAALDVLDDEFEREFDRSVREHPLVSYARTHDNLIITPHIAGSTVDAWRLTQQHTIQSVLTYLNEA
jgi:phosphoglycerate dehydrogenase-like enzyme